MIEATEADADILPPKLELHDAAELFLKELERASQTLRFESGGGRLGCMQSLQATINFLARRHANGALAYPFLRLKQALLDLEKTPPVVDALFSPAAALPRPRSQSWYSATDLLVREAGGRSAILDRGAGHTYRLGLVTGSPPLVERLLEWLATPPSEDRRILGR
jgi:hypothetical protein